LFGSDADEDVRRGFFETVPLHEARTAGYFIRITEVTFGDWLEYLASLGPEERSARMPRVGTGVHTGELRLDEFRPGGWRLTFKPAQKIYAVSEGQSVNYEGRQRRTVQNWLRFPVSAVSAQDAEAYVSWLSRTGRLRGARLCSEQEWERAARGADDRSYPHGYRLDPEDANYDATYAKSPFGMGPDEVGSHPLSRSPFGLEDLSGNAWEWTTSSFQEKQFVLRGGAYFYGRRSSQTANRQVPVPTVRDATVGFRPCATPNAGGSFQTR
jgi:formylglycine-generating enzyme required for sulfatase activity